MTQYVIGESADMFDPDTGEWVGVINKAGREQLIADAIGAGDGSTTLETVSTTTYTLTEADFDGKTKVCTNAGGCLVTVPQGLVIDAGQVVQFRQAAGAGQITFQKGGTGSVNSVDGSLTSGGENTLCALVYDGSEQYLLVGQIGDGAAPNAFTSRALVASDNGNVLVCATSQTATVNNGLPSGFGCMFKGAVSFAGTATVTDLRKSGETVIWCALVQTGTNTYDVLGGKA